MSIQNYDHGEYITSLRKWALQEVERKKVESLVRLVSVIINQGLPFFLGKPLTFSDAMQYNTHHLQTWFSWKKPFFWKWKLKSMIKETLKMEKVVGTTAAEVIRLAKAEAVKEKVDKAKTQLVKKYKELQAATDVVGNIQREIEDLELSIRQEFVG